MGVGCSTQETQVKGLNSLYISEEEFNQLDQENKINKIGPPNCSIADIDAQTKLSKSIDLDKQKKLKDDIYKRIEKSEFKRQQLALPCLLLKDSQNYYKGQWKNRMMDGYGELFFQNGEYYCGQFFEGKAHGEGALFHANGDIYQGEFESNCASGKGNFYSINGITYRGDWKNDSKEGRGVLEQKGIMKYDGDFKNGVKEGKGTFELINIFEYKGSFKNDVFDDNVGVLSYCDETRRKYKGQFKDNQMNGQGTFEWPQAKYEGNYQNNKKQGHGQFHFLSGISYIGHFEDGQMHDSNAILQIDEEKINVSFNNGTFVKSNNNIDQSIFQLLNLNDYNEYFYK